MKILLFLAAIIITAISSGCVSSTAITTDGRECKALSDDQITYLVVMTRNAVKKNAKKHHISDRELAFIVRTKPDIQIKYRGDCFGTMSITWETPYHIVGMRFEDYLDARFPQCAFMLRGTDGKKFQKAAPNAKTRRPGGNILQEQYTIPEKR
jgi:hypothetical protein